MGEAEDPTPSESDKPSVGLSEFRAERRRSQEADRRMIAGSLKAIRESHATLARCVVRSPFVGIKRMPKIVD